MLGDAVTMDPDARAAFVETLEGQDPGLARALSHILDETLTTDVEGDMTWMPDEHLSVGETLAADAMSLPAAPSRSTHAFPDQIGAYLIL